MKQTLVVSERGQITLPIKLRKLLGLESGSSLIAEDRDGGVLLSPALTVPIEIYSDEQIAQWAKQDKLSPVERKRILKQWGKSKR